MRFHGGKEVGSINEMTEENVGELGESFYKANGFTA